MNTGNEAKALTMLERFEVENDRIIREARQADKEARSKIGEFEKKLSKAKAKREKAAAQFSEMRAGFEKIEAAELEAEQVRIGGLVNRKSDMIEGSISLEEYYRTGQTERDINKAAREAADERLGHILEAVRIKGLEVLQLEVEEAECEREIQFLTSYQAAFMLERMRARIKSLEAALSSNPGGYMPQWTTLEQKKGALARATGKAMLNEVWHDLDLAAVKRMRFEAALPDSEIPELNKIISEMEARPDSKVSLRFLATGEPRGLSVLVWR